MTGAEPPILCVAGPTASGKTAVAIELARRLGGEIVSADARQVYRHLDIGTAKPTDRERSLAPHHLIDYVDPREEYNAGRFVRDAEAAVAAIRGRGNLPIVAGGTGLYFRALTRGLDVTVGRDDAVREELQGRIEEEGSAALHEELSRIDPPSAAAIHPNDPVRIVRALEIHRVTGRTRSSFHRAGAPPRHESRMAVLDMPREMLYERIDLRFDLMMEGGFLGEVHRLLGMGYEPALPAFRSPGYRELFAHLRGTFSLEEAVRRAKREHRRYAKRQITWFRREEAKRFPLSPGGGVAGTATAVAEWYGY